MEHSCLAARCSSCKIRVIRGEVNHLQEDFVLTAAGREQGFVLSCNVKPRIELEFDLEDLRLKYDPFFTDKMKLRDDHAGYVQGVLLW